MVIMIKINGNQASATAQKLFKEHNNAIMKGVGIVISIILLILSSIRFAALLALTSKSFIDNPTSKNNSLLDSNLVNIGNTLYQLALTLQHIVLIDGFLKSGRNGDKGNINIFDYEMTVLENGACSWRAPFVIGLLVMLYGFASIVAPILLSVWFGDFVLWFDDNLSTEKYAAGIYAGFAWVQHFSNGALRVVMIIVAFAVVAQWSSSREMIKGNTDIKSLGKNYKEVGKTASALNVVFQGWFIIQWIILFIAVTGKGTLLIKALIEEEYTNEKERLIYIAVHVAFDILSFLVPYSFGLVINWQHGAYYEELKERQEEILSVKEEESVKMMMYTDLIPKNPNFDFLPSLCGFSIPLDSAGYILTIVLALLAFISTFLVAFADITKI